MYEHSECSIKSGEKLDMSPGHERKLETPLALEWKTQISETSSKTLVLPNPHYRWLRLTFILV